MSVHNPRGMGAVPCDEGFTFRVWAPFAESVALVGDFDWDPKHLDREDGGLWSTHVPHASAGQRYAFEITRCGATFRRIDPYARLLDRENRLGVLERPTFEWKHDAVTLDRRALVVYEMHVGTFARAPAEPHRPGTFAEIERRLPYLARLGVGAIELMPVCAFPTELSWGYNANHLFAVEPSYGGPDGLRSLVDAAHGLGIGVIVDVTYNHIGPADLDLWQFDGWSENGKGGIYFYNDERAVTPWGDNRPDYGRAEVRAFLRDHALMWFDVFKVDGLRVDGTKYIRNAHGLDSDPEGDLADGWSFMQWMNDEIHHHYPGALTLAEDMADNAALTRPTSEGGAGFDAQWDVGFVHPVRAAVQAVADHERDLHAVAHAIAGASGEPAHARVVYTESHDEVANGRARLPFDITPDDPAGYHARRRSMLAATIAFTTPAIAMLFEGQEVLEDGWFRDDVAVDWNKIGAFPEVHRFYRRLVRLRRDTERARGLSGPHLSMLAVDDDAKVIAYHRWCEGGAGDDVVVVASFTNEPRHVRLDLPRAGTWRVRLDSTRDHVDEVAAETLELAPYAAMVLTYEGA